jgi:hypothetical protein
MTGVKSSCNPETLFSGSELQVHDTKTETVYGNVYTDTREADRPSHQLIDLPRFAGDGGIGNKTAIDSSTVVLLPHRMCRALLCAVRSAQVLGAREFLISR